MEGYNEDARAEVNQSSEYVGKSVPLLKRYLCGQLVLYNMSTPISSSTPCRKTVLFLPKNSMETLL